MDNNNAQTLLMTVRDVTSGIQHVGVNASSKWRSDQVCGIIMLGNSLLNGPFRKALIGVGLEWMEVK